jgi:DNA-binding IclR family transcriptional regulator
MTTDHPTAKTTVTSFRILEAIRDRNGAGVTELARELDLAKSAVYKHVMTLTHLGYLVKENTTYYLSLTLHGFGTQARERYPIHIAEPAIDNLARTTSKTANFMIYENGRGVYAYQTNAAETDTPPAPAFSTVPLHATAGGKAILAFLSADERDTVLQERELSAVTEKTITDPDALQHELQMVRDRRMAFDREEFAAGYQCAGSPVMGPDTRPVGAVSVGGAIQDVTGKRLEEDITGLVISTAKSIENDILSL